MKYQMYVNEQFHSNFEQKNDQKAIEYGKKKSKLYGPEYIIKIMYGHIVIAKIWNGYKEKNHE